MCQEKIMTKNLDELITNIANANAAYAQGIPYLTDVEYDKLWNELYQIDPTNKILYHTGNDSSLAFDKKRHKTQIFGTQKAFDINALSAFFERFGSVPLVIEPKYDGCAAVLYRGPDDSSDKLILEGNGIAGRDVSHHLEHLFARVESYSWESCEIIIPWANWDKSFGSNPRNTIAGWLAKKDISNHHHVAEIVYHNHGELLYPYKYNGNTEKLYEILLLLYQQWAAIYPLDGLMIKVFDHCKRLTVGNNGSVYAWSIAWKPPIQTAKTIVESIEWNVSRTGRVIPTVIYSPIELCGSVNKRVTGNNAKWLFDRNIRVGSTLVIGKAGEIIPKILSVDNQTSDSTTFHGVFHGVSPDTNTTTPGEQTPGLKRTLENCPVCNSSLKWSGVDLICDSPTCIAKLHRKIDYFYTKEGMEVLTIGPERIHDLLKNKQIYDIIKNKIWVLLDPYSYDIINPITDVLGPQITSNYLEAIQAINGKKNVINFMSGLGFESLGYKTNLKLFYYITYGKKFKGIPAKALSAFVDAFTIFKSAQKEMKNFQFAPVPPLPDKTYCITGILSNPRHDMITYLETKGWQYSNSVVTTLDYLVIGDKPGKTKLSWAARYQVPTITEDKLLNLFKKEPIKNAKKS